MFLRSIKEINRLVIAGTPYFLGEVRGFWKFWKKWSVGDFRELGKGAKPKIRGKWTFATKKKFFWLKIKIKQINKYIKDTKMEIKN